MENGEGIRGRFHVSRLLGSVLVWPSSVRGHHSLSDVRS